MTLRLTPYALAVALRAVATAFTLSLAAGVLLFIYGFAAVQYRELGKLKDELSTMPEARRGALERLAALETDLDVQLGAPYGSDGASRYRFATQVRSRLLMSGVSVLNLLPVRETSGGGSSSGVRNRIALRCEVTSPPSALLTFLGSLRSGPVDITVNPLRLRVEGDLLRGELTVGYYDYEQEKP